MVELISLGRRYGRTWAVRVEGEGRGYLLLQPEALWVSLLEGRVALATHLGNLVRLELEGEGLLLKVDLPPEGAPGMGERVRLALPEAAPFVKEEA